MNIIGLNIIVDRFENRIFESKYRPEIDVDDQESGLLTASDYKSYYLTDEELQMFRKKFNYKTPKELR